MPQTARFDNDHRQSAVESYILSILQQSQRGYSLGEIVRRAVTESDRLSPDEVRGAAAALVDEGKVRLTDDLQIRIVKAK